jgi:hypothetical protein
VRSRAGHAETQPLTYFESAALLFPDRPYLFWLIVGAVLALGSVALGLSTHQPVFLRSCIALAVGVTVVPFAMRVGVRVLVDWGPVLEHVAGSDAERARSWHASRVLELRSRHKPDWVGVVFVPWAVASFYYGGYFAKLSAAEATVVAAMIALAAFTAGIAVYYLTYLARVVWQMGQFQIRVDPHPFGIMRVGHGLTQCYLIAALIWLIISISGSWRAAVELRPVLLIGVPALGLIIGSFVFCQIPLHRQMTRYKQDRLYQLDQAILQLQAANPDALDDPGMRRLTFLRQEQERLTALPEWPFGWRSLAGLSVSSLAPLLPIAAKGLPGLLALLTRPPHPP